ncbi:MAG: NADH-quinone oxidoreductase subunit NuoH [Anaerolineales bacterium]|nr:NADH-quinone oxidoreductase subunit NuoH [Anaerolineales bacterium]MDW8278093.1 NADH-quinone oxidoreductase subunit NuoH [Anaerolineales bacterium]
MNFWTDPIKVIYDWLMITLTGWGMSGWLADVLINLLGIIVLITAAMVLDILLVWVERKVVARFQDRLGPNRVGPFGLFQPFPDIIKLIIKEDITPAGADKVVFNLAPILSLASVIFLWAVIPLAANVYGVDLNVALLYLVAAGAIGTLSIIMAGWASNNKYALLGAYRMVAVMISYEIPMIVALLIPTLLAGTMSMKGITLAQQDGLWFVVLSPLGMLLFLVAAIAELGRAPFDLSEGESEIVSGFHIEYSGMKFGLFYAGELLHAFTFGAFVGILFFGGWNWPLPWGDKYPLIGIFNVLAKGMFFYWVIMWVKYTVPRLRIDHMLAFNWKFLTPLAFALLIVTAVVHAIFKDLPLWAYGLAMFLSNILLGWAVLEILRSNARQERAAEETPAPAAQH